MLGICFVLRHCHGTYIVEDDAECEDVNTVGELLSLCVFVATDLGRPESNYVARVKSICHGLKLDRGVVEGAQLDANLAILSLFEVDVLCA